MSEDLDLATSNVLACAYNAAVNFGSERAAKKMRGLIEAINLRLRIEGKERLQALVDQGIIEGFNACPPECEMRPGGLFHVKGCENDMNHPVYHARRDAAMEKLAGGRDGHAGWRAASVTLVGSPALTTGAYYSHKNALEMANTLAAHLEQAQ